jgi:hypothetical protein
MGLLRQHLPLRELWVGPDFALGHRREGTVTRLAEIGQGLAYQVHAVSPLVLNGQTVSSTLIRHLVRQGQVEAAARLLKRRHHVSGTVVPDDQRGHYLGSPTAQVVAADGLALPAGGVYAAYAQLGARQWPTLAYVGLSLAGTERRLEVHMPDLAGDLDGQSLRVEFVRRLPSDAPLYLSRILDCANGEGPGPGASPEPCLSQPPKHSPVSRAWVRFEADEGSTRPRLQGKADRISACRSYVSERGAWETWSSIRGTERAPGS